MIKSREIAARLLHDFDADPIIHQFILQTNGGVIVLANCNSYERVIHFDAEALAEERTSRQGHVMCGMGNSMIV